eukprot:15482707-Alexandrium_andersonii.AAC.1
MFQSSAAHQVLGHLLVCLGLAAATRPGRSNASRARLDLMDLCIGFGVMQVLGLSVAMVKGKLQGVMRQPPELAKCILHMRMVRKPELGAQVGGPTHSPEVPNERVQETIMLHAALHLWHAKLNAEHVWAGFLDSTDAVLCKRVLRFDSDFHHLHKSELQDFRCDSSRQPLTCKVPAYIFCQRGHLPLSKAGKQGVNPRKVLKRVDATFCF